MKPRMFIGSSVEHLDLAYAAQEGLEHDVEATVWTQGVFALSRTNVASLIEKLNNSDFGLFILAPADITALRTEKKRTVRDNVVFELGMFIGRLGGDRCFVVVPRGVDDLHLPTDLLGMTPADYDPNRQDGNMVAALGPACSRIRNAVKQLKATSPSALEPVETSMQEGAASLCSDPDDCISLIQSWMRGRPARENLLAIHYDEVDRGLKLVPGSARLYIEQAAARWYVAARKGKETILFEQRRLERRVIRSSYF